jgi:hypothetical protein
VPNPNDSTLLDIVFEINVLGAQEELYKSNAPEEYYEKKKAGLLDPVKDVITFSFDGKTYISNKQFPKQYQTAEGYW